MRSSLAVKYVQDSWYFNLSFPISYNSPESSAMSENTSINQIFVTFGHQLSQSSTRFSKFVTKVFPTIAESYTQTQFLPWAQSCGMKSVFDLSKHYRTLDVFKAGLLNVKEPSVAVQMV